MNIAGLSPPHERRKLGSAAGTKSARDGRSISITLRSHCYVLGIPLYRTNACESVNAAFAGKRGYNEKHESRTTKRTLADATKIDKGKDLDGNNDERILETLQRILSRGPRQYSCPPSSRNFATRKVNSFPYSQRCRLRRLYYFLNVVSARLLSSSVISML